ncbi:STAS domain-containing protein [Streptomyces sp. NBC_01077]|uniref:STAS domain-containing protein n=1 Tax=Streptomyces sp. NBC_01077 TaxID=2903746 RepID=UPI00386A43C5|nr:STAS domain-containing protein [Streptomyces sp. NBC_01077]WSV43738.1 STAS domain-containing protein [Streptomyces sp. NBC_01077]
MSTHVLVIRDGRQAVAYVSGELDIATAPRIRQTLLDTVHRHEQVIIDLDRLDFCDCAGLSSLITAQKTAHARSAALTIRNIPPQLARLLRHVPHTLPIELPRPGVGRKTGERVNGAEAVGAALSGVRVGPQSIRGAQSYRAASTTRDDML